MSTQVPQPFPPDGKVLVIGMAHPRLEAKFGTRVCWINTWEILGKTSLPEGVAAICIARKTRQDHKDRIKLLGQSLGVTRFEVEENLVTLEERLKFWFQVNGDPPHGEPIAAKPGEGEIRIPVDRIKPFDQPRTHFSRARLKELMRSIMAIGQQTPIIVRRLESDRQYDYELVDGERRLRACTLIGAREMLAVVRTVTSKEDQYVRSFVANFAREGHTPLDTARAIARIRTSKPYQDMPRTEAMREIAALAGKNELWAYQYLKLLSLPTEIQKMLEPDDDDQYKLSLSVAKFLCTIEDKSIQLRVCDEVVKKALSASKAMALARQLAARSGVGFGSDYSPRKEYAKMRTLVRKTVEGAENFLGMQHQTIDDLFEHRPLSDRKETVAELDKAIRLLTKLRESIVVKQPTVRTVG